MNYFTAVVYLSFVLVGDSTLITREITLSEQRDCMELNDAQRGYASTPLNLILVLVKTKPSPWA